MICKECNRDRPITNVKRCLCDDCNFKRLHSGKSKQQIYLERAQSKPVKKPIPIRSKKVYQYKLKTTGEKEFFLEIWSEREHICSNPKCRRNLGDIPNVFFFSHIKSKGAFPELRLCKDNIELLCIDCHQKYEFGSRE